MKLPHNVSMFLCDLYGIKQWLRTNVCYTSDLQSCILYATCPHLMLPLLNKLGTDNYLVSIEYIDYARIHLLPSHAFVIRGTSKGWVVINPTIGHNNLYEVIPVILDCARQISWIKMEATGTDNLEISQKSDLLQALA
jgi:hypothetical protein